MGESVPGVNKIPVKARNKALGGMCGIVCDHQMHYEIVWVAFEERGCGKG
jgi:hypothetical protein